MISTENVLFVASFALILLIVFKITSRKENESSLKTLDADGALEPAPANIPEAEKFRPFKPNYHVTMGIGKTNILDWIVVEDTYERVTSEHVQLMESVPQETCLVDPRASGAVREVYDTTIEYLVARYPEFFLIKGGNVVNKILSAEMPRLAGDLPATRLLKLIGQNIEEDIHLLEYDHQGQEYNLRASTGFGANGFYWRKKFGNIITRIHVPVPQYKEKLQFSMNRYFDKMQVGKWVRRFTWGIQLGSDLFKPEGNHNAKLEGDSLKASDLDFSNVFMRLEKQVLTRLPRSKFIMFTVKTYFYPLCDIKKEGFGPAMVRGFDAWPEDMKKYKSFPLWSSAVREYMEVDES